MTHSQTPRPKTMRVGEQPNRKYQPQHRAANTKRCQRCQVSNPEGRCGHCYKCGSAEHWAPQTKLKPCYILEKRRTAPPTGKQQQAAKLVGKRCLVGASLGGVDTTILWDTGSQVSIVGVDWKRKHLPDVEMRPVKELLEENKLDLLAANGTDIPYGGWMGVEFTLSKNAVSGMSDEPVLFPVLVVSSDLERPIIGFNVCSPPAQL